MLALGSKTLSLNVSIFISFLRMYLTIWLRDTGYFGLVVRALCQRASHKQSGPFLLHQTRPALRACCDDVDPSCDVIQYIFLGQEE